MKLSKSSRDEPFTVNKRHNHKDSYNEKFYKKPYRQSSKKWQPRCYKCQKLGHKAYTFPLKFKINELFQDDKDLCDKITTLISSDVKNQGIHESPNDDSEEDLYVDNPSSDSYEEDVCQGFCPLTINVIKKKTEQERLFDLIEKVPNEKNRQ